LREKAASGAGDAGDFGGTTSDREDLPPTKIADESKEAAAIASDEHLYECAKSIRKHSRRMVGDAIEIGRNLALAHSRINNINGGGWYAWLQENFGWSVDTADRYMHVAELARSRNLRDANLPLSCFYLIAGPDTPDEARDEILERAQTGERVPVAEAKKIIKAHKRAKPAKKSNTVENRKTPRRATNAKDIGLSKFDGHILRLLQMVRKAKPVRFAKTSVSAADLTQLSKFLLKVGAS
jgi:hypothetical protein